MSMKLVYIYQQQSSLQKTSQWPFHYNMTDNPKWCIVTNDWPPVVDELQLVLQHSSFHCTFMRYASLLQNIFII